MKIVGLLTGRGNNSLKDKNILEVCGKPVLYYPSIAGRDARLVEALYCSSDDEKILSAASDYGYTPIVRPAELALPTSQHEDCIRHALGVMNEEGVYPDILVVLLANNVTVKADWVDECVQKMIDDPSLTAVVPVYVDNDHHPFRAKKVNSDGNLEPFEDLNGEVSTNRQDLPTCCFLSHNFWVINVKSMLSGEGGQQPWKFMGNKIAPFYIEESIDIHKQEDLLLAECWVKDNM